MNRRRFVRDSLGLGMLTAATRHGWALPGEVVTLPTRYGPVSGGRADGITVFKGIPYGADTRWTRFQPPKPPAAWKQARLCSEWGDRAPQLGGNGMTSHAAREASSALAATYRLPPDEGAISEDCLHVNVWTPAAHASDGKQRPVLVYIHGGAYNAGSVNSALYDGTHLAQRGDAVVVTVNHRLNAFGFLYLAGISDDPALADSGNVGMLDLVQALRWVHENIGGFGGDRKRVTIFGQSGGGAKCATLMAVPLAHGLFQRVMSMSGQQVTAAPPAIATARTKQFLERLGLAETPGSGLRAALEVVPFEQLEEAARVSSAWLPVVDGRSLPRDPFSPDAPPLSDDVAMILGNTHDETRGLIGSTQPQLFALSWEDLPAALAKNVGVYLGPISPKTAVERYRQWYPQYSPADVFFAASTAFRSWPGQVIEAERRAASPAQRRTWVYEMDWASPAGDGRYRAPHTVDIPFFFDNLRFAPRMVGAGEAQISAAQPLADQMSASLIAFARTGNPNTRGVPAWPAYDLNRRATMVWKVPAQVEDDPRGNERKLAAGAHYRQPGT